VFTGGVAACSKVIRTSLDFQTFQPMSLVSTKSV